jgi:hypothetical protein
MISTSQFVLTSAALDLPEHLVHGNEHREELRVLPNNLVAQLVVAASVNFVTDRHGSEALERNHLRVVLEEIPELRCRLITDTWEVRWQPGHPVSHSPPGLPRPQVFSDGSTRCRGPVAEFTCWGESGRHYSLPPAPPCAEPAATSRPTGVSRSAVRHRLAERS